MPLENLRGIFPAFKISHLLIGESNLKRPDISRFLAADWKRCSWKDHIHWIKVASGCLIESRMSPRATLKSCFQWIWLLVAPGVEKAIIFNYRGYKPNRCDAKVWRTSLWCTSSHTQNPKSAMQKKGCLGYIGDCTTQLCGDYSKPL